MKGSRAWIPVAALLMALGTAPTLRAESNLFTGLDLGAAVPVEKSTDRLDTGGTFSPYVAYMWNDFLGLMAQAQVVGFPNENRPGIRDKDATWAFGFHGGPRIAEPFSLSGMDFEAYQTFQFGVFTGLSGDTPISRTSYGISTGGGINWKLNELASVGAWARYNMLDQRVNPTNEVQFVTTGISFTYILPLQ
jgi:hypothetical protein